MSIKKNGGEREMKELQWRREHKWKRQRIGVEREERIEIHFEVKEIGTIEEMQESYIIVAVHNNLVPYWKSAKVAEIAEKYLYTIFEGKNSVEEFSRAFRKEVARMNLNDPKNLYNVEIERKEEEISGISITDARNKAMYLVFKKIRGKFNGDK